MNNPTCKFSGKGVNRDEHRSRKIDRDTTRIYTLPVKFFLFPMNLCFLLRQFMPQNINCTSTKNSAHQKYYILLDLCTWISISIHMQLEIFKSYSLIWLGELAPKWLMLKTYLSLFGKSVQLSCLLLDKTTNHLQQPQTK